MEGYIHNLEFYERGKTTRTVNIVPALPDMCPFFPLRESVDDNFY